MNKFLRVVLLVIFTIAVATTVEFVTPVYAQGSVPNGYTFCANENERCNFSGRMDVAYGAQGRYEYWLGATGGIDCNNATFGDPIYGVQKACYYKISSRAATASFPCPNSIGITLYEHINYTGRSIYFGPDTPISSDLSRRWFNFNDMASSVCVGRYTWRVCEHAGYGGRCETFRTPGDPDLRDNSIGNDTISSIRQENWQP